MREDGPRREGISKQITIHNANNTPIRTMERIYYFLYARCTIIHQHREFKAEQGHTYLYTIYTLDVAHALRLIGQRPNGTISKPYRGLDLMARCGSP